MFRFQEIDLKVFTICFLILKLDLSLQPLLYVCEEDLKFLPLLIPTSHQSEIFRARPIIVFLTANHFVSLNIIPILILNKKTNYWSDKNDDY
jgi:hypothetical protein